MSWTDERVELLKKLWADGLSASQIAGELGGFPECADGGRSAVIGKVHRLGLQGRGRAKSSKSTMEKKARKPRTLTLKRPPMPPTVAERILDDEPLDLPEIPLGQRRTLLELNEATCRWPFGDPQAPDFYFCGGKPLEGLPYCGAHARAAYQPGSAQRKRAG